MSGEQALERSVLERKERDELHTIAEALGVKPGTRTKKADLIMQILVAAGVEPRPPEEAGDDKPRRARRTTKNGEEAYGAAGHRAVGAEAAGSNGSGRVVHGPEADGGVAARPDDEAPAVIERGTHEALPAGDGGAGAVRAGDEAPAEQAEAGSAVRAVEEGTGEPGAATAGGEPAAGDGGAGRGESQVPARQGRDNTQGRETGQGRDNTQGRENHGGRGQGGGQQTGFGEGDGRRSRRRRGRDRDRDRDFRVQEQNAEQQYQGELVTVAGLLDLTEQGYGFLRTKGYLPAGADVYVSTSQARRFALRKGDHVEGAARPAIGNEKYGALLRIDTVSGLTPDEARARRRFEDLTPLFPDVKLRMERPGLPAHITGRIIDLICPIGKGQRGMIVSPPKAGKTTVIKEIATALEANNPDVHLMVLLVDERPEEVTDMRRTVKGEVVASTFDRPSDEHTIVAELALERAKRLVELGRDVVIILDGITRLARAYNLSAPASGRLTSGGIDQAAIYPPKKFFGAARNIEEGGSLTILATALVETGSKADDVIFEEFKGTGNMELRLDRRLAERRIYPAIDVNASSTRHEELLFEGRKQLDLVWRLRRVLNGLAEDGSSARSLELLIEKIRTTHTNDEFLAEVARAQGTI